jgi:hypothetical protein
MNKTGLAAATLAARCRDFIGTAGGVGLFYLRLPGQFGPFPVGKTPQLYNRRAVARSLL